MSVRHDIGCPRHKTVMREMTMGEALVDICPQCLGTFFDSGEICAAAGIAADPSSWDRPETGGVVKEGTLRCPRCEHVVMQVQDVDYEDHHVEIDRCGKCGGIWLDRDEVDTLIAIGSALRPILDAERAKAQVELEAMGNPAFRNIARTKRITLGIALLVLGVVLYGVYDRWRQAEERAHNHRLHEDWSKEGGTGCPCGCDRSKAMAARLRREKSEVASGAIEKTLVTIAEREALGYITERMIAHRLRMLDVAKELSLANITHGASSMERCKTQPIENESVRVCSDLMVHGERIEIVDGHEKLITSSFRLWLEIENRTNAEQRFAQPSFEAGAIHLPVSRWYEEGTAGEPWNGVLAPHGKIRVNVIGDVPEHIPPDTRVEAAIGFDSVTMRAVTRARRDIHDIR